MPTAQLNGIDTYFERTGDGRPLLFLNASGATLASGSLLADRLTKPLFILGPGPGAALLKRFGARAVWLREAGESAPDTAAAPRLCYVPSEGLAGILAVKEIEPCPSGR